MPEAFILFLFGIVCGFLNAAASSGSAITLPLLLSLGLPPAVANGTNRLPVLVGMLTAVFGFQRAGAIPWRYTLRLLPVFLFSAVFGSVVAIILPMNQIRLIAHAAVLLAFLLLLLKPQRWLSANADTFDTQPPSLLIQILMGLIGVWTGLIVLDAGTYLLVIFVLVGGLSLQKATAIKAVLIGAATVLSLIVFIIRGDVDWVSAFPLMLGSAVGGRFGSALAIGPRAKVWIYRLLLLSLFIELSIMLYDYLRAPLLTLGS